MLSQYKQDSLRDLIKKRFQSSSNINTFISKTISEIKEELNKSEKDVKIHALLKLIFLYLNYCDISWASFNSLEIMSTCGIKGKLIAYMIAGIQFKNNSDFIQLIPNQIRSDLKKTNLNNINSALNCANSIMNHSLAVELIKDYEAMLNLNNEVIRKKTIMALTSACTKFAMKGNFEYWEDYSIRITSLLANQAMSKGVAICIISSIQKMCSINPAHCMMLFIDLMNYFIKCEINWNLIKLIDIFRMLFKYEPKFAKKKEFIKIIAEQLAKTKSKSVEEELVRLVITNFDIETNPNAAELINSSEERLKTLLVSQDLNLLLLSLKIINDIKHKNQYENDLYKIIENNKDNIQILKEAICILKQIANEDNYIKIVEVVNKLSEVISDTAIDCILSICTKDNYAYLKKDDRCVWFANLMFDLGYRMFIVEGNEKPIADVIRNLSQNVESIRETIVESSFIYLKKILSFIKENSKDKLFSSKEEKKDTNNIDKIKFNALNNSNIASVEMKTFSPIRKSALIEVICFIIGEYSNKEETANAICDIIKEYNEILDSEYTDFIKHILLCELKLCIRLNLKSISQMKALITNFFNFHKNSEIELHDISMLILSFFQLDLSTTKISEAFNNNPLTPLPSNPPVLLPPAEIDINACFPISPNELALSKK